jgi:hypothetical protein
MLNCLAAAISPRERVITCEEAQVRYTRSKMTIKNGTCSVRRFEHWARARPAPYNASSASSSANSDPG